MLVRRLGFAALLLGFFGFVGLRVAEGLRSVPMPPVAQPLSDRPPRTLSEALDLLDGAFSAQQLAEMQTLSEEEMWVTYYQNLGRGMRNSWGLWSGKSGVAAEFCAMGLQDAEAMSVVILRSFWRRVHSLPLRVEEQVRQMRAREDKVIDEWRRAHPEEVLIRPSGCPVRDWID